MKKDYLKPEQHISVIEMEDLLQTSSSVGGTTDEFDSKDREDFEGEGDSGWGALW